jgi:hypothetical protein
MKTQPNDPIHAISRPLDLVNRDSDGLTKREYFAAMAIQGLLAYPRDPPNVEKSNVYNVFAKSAVAFSDALIKILNNEPNT